MTLDLKSTDLNRCKFTEENVVKLRDQFPLLDDETLARYLIAQNNDLEGAAKKLLIAEELKSEYWHIKKSQCIGEIKTGTAYLHGTDREGRPLLVLNGRLHDPDKRDLKEMILMTLWWTEQALAKLPESKSQFVILLDRDNCENALDTEYLQKVAEIFQDLHPERLHKAIVYPTGYVYYSMWNLILKWFMEEHTRSKVLPAITLNDVFDFIEEEYVPESLGGKCTYQFNPDDYSDPVYPEDLMRSLSNTTDESLGSGQGAGLLPPFTDPIVAESSFETHTTSEALSVPLTVEKTSAEGAQHEREIFPQKLEELLEFEDTEDQSGRTISPPLPAAALHLAQLSQRSVTPAKGLTVSPISSNPDLLALVGTPHALPLPLELPQPLVEEGWQEYVEYERSQHNSPTAPSIHTPSSRKFGRGEEGKEEEQEGRNEELFSPASEEADEDVWNDVDSISSSSRRPSFSLSYQPDGMPPPQPSTRPPLPPSLSIRIPAPVPVAELEPIEQAMTFSGSVDFDGETYMYNNANPARVRTILFPPSQDIQDLEVDRAVEVAEEMGVAEVQDSDESDECADLWQEVSSVDGASDADREEAGREEEGELEASDEQQGEVSPLSALSASNYSAVSVGANAQSAEMTEAQLAALASIATGERAHSVPLTDNATAQPPVARKDTSTATAYAQLCVLVVFLSAVSVAIGSILTVFFSPASPVPLTLLAQLVMLLVLLLSFV